MSKIKTVRLQKDPEVPVKEYIEAILEERKTQTEFSRLQLERSVEQARETTEKAMNEARDTVEKRLLEAKTSADDVVTELQKRLALLESGGAPFASRLDQSLERLKGDVDSLNEGAVKTTVLDALREQTTEDAKQQKRSLKYVGLTAGAALVVGLIEVGVQLLAGGGHP
jgi:archaellum component FlaD/FlaE